MEHRKIKKDYLNENGEYLRLINRRSYGFFFFCFLLSIFYFQWQAQAQQPSQICFKDHCLMVEVAADDASRVRGLQGRSSFANGAGMLFIFPQPDVYTFWMKDTLIPLDIIWLDDNRMVVDLKAQVPPCQENPCPVYTPSGNALYVLEINAGLAQTYGIRVADKAVFK